MESRWHVVLAVLFTLALMMGAVCVGLLASDAEDDRRSGRRIHADFVDYRSAVELCATLADSGEELRACVEQVP